MSDQPMPSMLDQGLTKTYQIPIGHLDYKFIEKCTDVKHLEKILKILRSGEEGYYPDLTLFCEKRIECLAPGSRALRKDKPAATAADFTTEEWEEINGEIKSWMTEMQEDYKIQLPKTQILHERLDNLPPVRGSDSCVPIGQNQGSGNKQRKKNVPRDYREWDKFDVEKECSKIDECYEENNSKSRLLTNSSGPKIETTIDITGMSQRERFFIANREKEKGNEAFATGDYKEAVTYYARSISVLPTAAAYNNKAQAEIKLKDWHSALQDCEKVLDMEPDNLKETGVLVQEEIATEKSEMGNVQKKFTSKGDGCRSDDKETQNQREHTESGAKNGRSENRTSKHLPDQEAEVNGYLNNDKKKSGNSNIKEENPRSCGTVSSSSGKNISTLLPTTAAKLKSEGNELFKNGQFGDAVLKYSEAIESAVNLGVQNPHDLSILYSNRAACYLKEGNCSDCIQDCNRALELQPFSLKPLLRRAMAYESMERYQQAYVDFKTVLQIDSGIQAANDSVNRITKTLIDQYGPSWREKLSPIPVVPVSAQQHRWNGTFTSESKQKSVTDVSGDRQLQINSEKTEERFRILKTEGNELVKKGKYNEALIKYNECMKLNSQESTVYTNRALCHLKLCKYEEAKQDCDRVLQIEDTNIKAFYRRALAYKGLQNYQASVDDLRKVLCIDPNVAEAKKELEEITQFLNPNHNVTASSQQKQRKKIKIHEVTESNKQESQVSTSEDAMINHIPVEGGAEKCVPLKRSEKLLISEPSTAYDFGQSINAVNARKDKAACADLLMIINPPKLPMLLSNKLDGDTFLIFIQALECYILGKDPGLVYQHLFYLSKAERFKVRAYLLFNFPL
uniref:Sperm associated antigen 1 n=1 Tax=Crocodylus porosus TaxID=8502 RepID=A0A7M4FSV6_CROPO